MTSIYSVDRIQLWLQRIALTSNTSFPFLLFPPFIHNGELSHFVHWEHRVQVSKNRPPPLNISIGSDLKIKNKIKRNLEKLRIDRQEKRRWIQAGRNFFFFFFFRRHRRCLSVCLWLWPGERETVLAAGLAVYSSRPSLTSWSDPATVNRNFFRLFYIDRPSQIVKI